MPEEMLKWQQQRTDLIYRETQKPETAVRGENKKERGELNIVASFQNTLEIIYPLNMDLFSKVLFQLDGRAAQKKRRRWFQGEKERLLVLLVS